MISINGVSYSGNNLVIKNGKVIIDGKVVETDDKVINITVNGNIDYVEVDACQTVTVTGSSGRVKTISGDIEIKGDVTGDVESISGDIRCGKIAGKVKTVSGDIKHL